MGKMLLVAHLAHVGENTVKYTNFRLIVITSLNISISVLRYVTPCS